MAKLTENLIPYFRALILTFSICGQHTPSPSSKNSCSFTEGEKEAYPNFLRPPNPRISPAINPTQCLQNTPHNNFAKKQSVLVTSKLFRRGGVECSAL